MITPMDIQSSKDLYGDVKAMNIEKKIEHSENKFQDVLDSTVALHPDKAISKDKPLDKKLMNACVEMESLFVSKMLKEMRKTVHKGEFLHGGYAEEIFEDMLYDEYALNLSKTSNLGLAKMIYNEMSRR